MIIYVLTFLWCLFVIVLLIVLSRSVLGGDKIYTFNDFGKADIPYITINVQGIDLNMIVDTGCGVSIITSDILGCLSFEESSRRINLEALTPDSLPSNTVTIPITVNNRVVHEDFVVYDKADIANFQANYGIVIHGILGNEFFDKVKCLIDYHKHTVTFY